MREFKICLLGSGSVGKSALAIQFTQNRFVESYDPTVEDCYRKEITVNNGKEKAMLEIIDTAGTEQFTSMVELYIKNCQGFVLVYDVTKKSTYEGLQEIKNLVWKVKGASGSNAPPMMVIGNKVDQAEREVNMAAGYNYAKEWKATFLETSAKTKVNVDETFMQIVEKIEGGNSKGCCTLQ